MDTTVVETGNGGKIWDGGNRPLRASYGKMMMWFFLISDALPINKQLRAVYPGYHATVGTTLC